MTCTDTGQPIQPAGTLGTQVPQCADCYLEGSETRCPTWQNLYQREGR